MGRASSNKKVARAARTAGRTRASRNIVWPMAMVAVVGLGLFLVLISVRDNDSAQAEPPMLGDHWHAAYGVYTCGQFQPPYSDAQPDTSGIHGHGDGLIHIHPFSTRYTGDGANLGAFAEQVGMVIEDDRLVLPDGTAFENGDDCGGEPGVVQVKAWAGGSDSEGRLLEGDFADFAPDNGSIVTIAFAPEGAEIPQPPSVGAVPTDLPPGAAPVGGTPSDGATPTTAADPSTASTDTTAPAADGAPPADPSATSVPTDGAGAATTAPAP